MDNNSNRYKHYIKNNEWIVEDTHTGKKWKMDKTYPVEIRFCSKDKNGYVTKSKIIYASVQDVIDASFDASFEEQSYDNPVPNQNRNILKG